MTPDRLPAPDSAEVRVAIELYAAIRDGRVADVLALTTTDVTCEPLIRPGLTWYEGHEGMARLVAAMHDVHGSYQVEIISATEQPGLQVTVQARIIPEAGRGEPLAITSRYVFRDGLIFAIESFGND